MSALLCLTSKLCVCVFLTHWTHADKHIYNPFHVLLAIKLQWERLVFQNWSYILFEQHLPSFQSGLHTHSYIFVCVRSKVVQSSFHLWVKSKVAMPTLGMLWIYCVLTPHRSDWTTSFRSYETSAITISCKLQHSLDTTFFDQPFHS